MHGLPKPTCPCNLLNSKSSENWLLIWHSFLWHCWSTHSLQETDWLPCSMKNFPSYHLYHSNRSIWPVLLCVCVHTRFIHHVTDLKKELLKIVHSSVRMICPSPPSLSLSLSVWAMCKLCATVLIILCAVYSKCTNWNTIPYNIFAILLQGSLKEGTFHNAEVVGTYLLTRFCRESIMLLVFLLNWESLVGRYSLMPLRYKSPANWTCIL